MRTLYKEFIVATLFILLSSMIIAFALANTVYFAFTKEKIDRQNVAVAEEIISSVEQTHDSKKAAEGYLDTIAKLGYQMVLVDRLGNMKSFGDDFADSTLSDEAVQTVLNGEVFHGMRNFSDRFLMMSHFSNKLENTVGAPLQLEGESYGLFLRPTNKMLFSDMHMVIAGFVFTIAIVSIVGVILMTRKLIRPITQLTEATKAVANENYDYELRISRRDELGQLAQSFHSMQKQLAHNDKARKTFINNVSHDFQSPLMNIQGYAELLQSGQPNEEDYQEYASIIDREARHLSSLTKQLLLLTSLDQGAYPLKKKRVCINQQLKEVIRKIQWLLEEKGIELSYQLDECYITADEELLLNVWENLLSNAIKYTNESGRIQIICRAAKGNIEVLIKDTGIGIEKAHQEEIFERFYRVDEARKKKDGTGLGLSIVKEIVELHGGKISLESESGEGSSFKVFLPK
ncbi:sensor histidine kinase [Gracilibacillus sp. Marseille-QA3620]